MTRIPLGSRWACAAVVAVGLSLGGASVAQAQEGEWYVGANLPLMFIDDTDSVSTGTSTLGGPPVEHRSSVRTEHDTGFKLGAVLGHQLQSGLRIEGEIFLARAEVSRLTHSSITVSAPQLTIPGEFAIPVSGSAEQLGAMVSLWYDFDTGDAWAPYFGGGLGFIRVDQGGLSYNTNAVAQRVADEFARLHGQPAPTLPPGFVPTLSPTDTAFAYQIGAGISYPLSETTTLQVGYRMQMVDGLSFSGTNAMATVRSETDLRIHFLELGIRHRF